VSNDGSSSPLDVDRNARWAAGASGGVSFCVRVTVKPGPWLDIDQADSSATVDNSTVSSKAVQESQFSGLTDGPRCNASTSFALASYDEASFSKMRRCCLSNTDFAAKRACAALPL